MATKPSVSNVGRSQHEEAQRVAALASFGILDTAPEPAFDTIVETAQRLFRCKTALITFVAHDRQWFKAKRGLDVSQTERDHAFCAHAVAADRELIVPDTAADARFKRNPHVTGPPHVRFYAGVPIRGRLPRGSGRAFPLGTLCVIDDEPRTPDPDDIQTLRNLAGVVEALLEARASATRALAAAEERRGAIERLDRTHRQFRQAERMANIGSWRLTLNDSRTEWSEQTFAIHGLEPGDGPTMERALNYYPVHAREMMTEAVARTIETGEPFTVETDLVTAHGDKRRVRSMGELEMRNGIPIAVIGVFQDITNRYVMEEALRQTAYTDELTRIASRGRFNQFVDEQIEGARQRNAPLALLLIDLDHFKSVNDQCGHAVGDELLRLIASRLQVPYLADSFAARLGGDEFVLLVTCRKTLSNLRGLLRRLLVDLRHSVGADRARIHVSATIGASWLSDQVQTRSELLLNADMALYRAKQSLRGSAAIAGEEQIVVAHSDAPAALRLVS